MLNALTFLLSVVFLALIAFVFLYAYFFRSRKTVYEKWGALLSDLRRRLDMLPLLIEVIKKYTSDQHDGKFQEIIELRGNVWPVTGCDRNHIESEFEISEKIKFLFSLGRENEELNRDTDFLSLKNDFHEIAQKIDDLTNEYNNGVRSFNENILFKILGGLFRFFGFNKLLIFEFEE
jgi:LemA protein